MQGSYGREPQAWTESDVLKIVQTQVKLFKTATIQDEPRLTVSRACQRLQQYNDECNDTYR